MCAPTDPVPHAPARGSENATKLRGPVRSIGEQRVRPEATSTGQALHQSAQQVVNRTARKASQVE